MRSSLYTVLGGTFMGTVAFGVSEFGFPIVRLFRTAPMQGAALAFTILAPLLLRAVCRRFPALHFQNLVRRTLAVGLLAFEFAMLGDKIATGASPETALPMHLCDWVLFAVAASLWFRWQVARLRVRKQQSKWAR